MAAARSHALHREELSRDEPREIHELCLEWAAWARCPAPGGGSEASGYLRERTAAEHAGEPTPQIALMDKAVGKMYVDRPKYKPAFKRYYLNPTALSEEEIADELGTRPDLVNAILRQARMAIGTNLHQLRNAK